MLDAGGAVLASTATQISLSDPAGAPLELTRQTPDNAARDVDPNRFIALYFNHSIDPQKLQVSVHETVHGLDYDLSNQQGVGFTQLPEPQLVEQHRDMEPVAGALAYYPSDRYVSFHPERRFGYGATVFVEVSYAGEELARYRYAIEPLPTLIAGAIKDQLGTPVVGISVALPALNQQTKTDSNGNYLMKIRGQASAQLRNGRYLLRVNPNMAASGFGTLDNWADVEAGRLSEISTQLLPLLNRSIAFQNIEGGQAQTLLARGNLTLDLSRAQLQFPGGSSRDNVHVQMLNANELPFRATPAAIPAWMYAVQPSGVKVEGEVGIRIAMPRLYGSLDYLPPAGTRVAMLGFNPNSKHIEVIGVGKIDNQQVKSHGKLPLQTLDYIGYAFVKDAAQSVLKRYEQGEISSLGLLRSELEGVN